MRALIVIPARMNAARLPDKPMLAETGKTLLEHTVRQAWKTGLDLMVATPDNDISNEAQRLGVERHMSTKQHDTGSSRAHAAWSELASGEMYDYILNWQVDEPEVDPLHVRLLLEQMVKHSEYDVGTLLAKRSVCDRDNMDNVKVATATAELHVPDEFGAPLVRRCLWFTRAPMEVSYTHIGVYVFRRVTIGKWANSELTFEQEAEGLEQLGWLQSGARVMGLDTLDYAPSSINSPEDYERFVANHPGEGAVQP